MSMLIKGKMPNTCFECLTDSNRNVFCDGLCARLTPEEAKIARHPNCPIIGEIPDSYGRLIDADKAKKAIRARIDNTDRKPDGSYYHAEDAFFINGLIRAIQSIEKIPTILEASE